MLPSINPVVESIPEALSIFVNQIVYDKQSKGERVYTFSLGEAFFKVPRFEVSDEDFQRGYHYSNSMGQPALRKKIAEMYHDYYSVSADPETEILVSAGSKAIIYMLLKTVVSGGEEVLVHEPAWLSYSEQIRLAGGICVPIPYDKGITEWEGYITDKTKVIIVNNPNNPSGQLYSRRELERLYEIAEKYGLFVMVDEAYSDFILPGDRFISFASVDTKKEHCLIVNSLSKNMGLSGWRVGYTIAHAEVIRQLLKLNQHIITCAPTLLQDYMAAHFEEILNVTIPQAREMAVKRKAVQEIMDEVGIRYIPGSGTFYFMIDVSDFKGTTEELVYTLLLKDNIATVPGRAYGISTAGHIRFGIGVENLEDTRKCLLTIRHYLELPSFDGSGIRRSMKEKGIL